MEETYQLIEGSPTLHDLDAENGFLWCPLGYSERLNEPGILVRFLPWRRAETCAGVLQAGEGQRRQEPCGDSCRSKGRRGE